LLIFSTALTRTIQVEAGSSIPYLVLNLGSSSSVKSSFRETELVETDRIFFFTAKVRVVSFFYFLNRLVSLNRIPVINILGRYAIIFSLVKSIKTSISTTMERGI
jgi:hypothetical protein